MFSKLKIISGGDANYFELMKELALSMRCLPGGDQLDIAYLDGGLLEEQKEYFRSQGIDVVDPGWRHPEAKKRSRGREYLKVEIAKVHMDQIFPDADILVWIDADAWVQNFRALELFEMVADKGKFAIVSQASRMHPSTTKFRHLFWKWGELRNILYKNARRAGLPGKITKNMMARPTLNAGVFALKNGAPHWERFRYWQDYILQGKRGRIFTATQLSFGVSVYEENLPYEALPDICNFMGPYRWDDATCSFVDYFAPYEQVSILHMVGKDEMRIDPKSTIKIVDINDNVIDKSLRFSEVKTGLIK